MYGRQQYDLDKNLYKREKNWNQRFVLDKIPKFDAYNDINYVSLGLFKSKIRYEERIKKEEAKSKKYAGRIYSAHYMKPKSTSKIPKENIIYNNTININNKKPRNPSMRISLDPTINFNKANNNKISKHKTLNNFHYQGTLTTHNIAGGNTFNYMPDYKNRNLKINIRNIICEEDPEIFEEYEIVRELWEKLGVTENYVNNFDFMLNGKINDRDSVLEMIIGEKKQMKKFRLELMKVISEITKRENKINDLKQFIKTYEQIEEIIKQKEKEKKQGNNENENTEKKDEKILMKSKNIGEVNKDLIGNDIHDCLKSLRLRTINTVNILTKFKTTYFNLFNNKINLEFIKKKYGFNDKYLTKLNNDLDFLKDTIISKIYHFSEKGGDPFLLCISDKCGDPADVPQYRQLPISNEILSVVKGFKFSLEQEEVFSMIKNKRNRNDNNSNISYKYKNNAINSYNSLYNRPYNNSYNNIYNSEYNNAFGNSFSSNNANNIKFNNYNNNLYTNNNKYNNKLLLNEKQLLGSNNNFYYNKNNKNYINENLLSANFKGNVEDEKVKLKVQNEYRNVFFNTEEKDDDTLINQNMNNKPIQKEEENKDEIPGMTSKQLYRHLAKYNKIKREIFPPFNKDLIKEEVQKNIIQKIEERMNKVEKDFKSMMDEKFKNEQKKIKEEEIRLKNEKEKIEKMRIEEEEDRKKKEEKYFKFEEERAKRKSMDKKKKEENERFAKRENDVFLREIQMKFMKEVEERFKKESDRQFELKKDEITDAEAKDKMRKEAIERIRHEEFKKVKKGEVLVDLRNEEDRVKIGNEVITNNNGYNEKSVTTSNNKEENSEKDSHEESENKSKNSDKEKSEENEEKDGNDNDKSSKKNNVNNDESESDKNNKDNSEENKSKTSKKESSNNQEKDSSKNKKSEDDISEDFESI